jgi:beta-lactam-binding protein with PASTA domain
VTGLTLAKAKAALAKVGLRVESERANGGSTTRDDDRVVDSDVAPGRQVPKGATITLQTARRQAS